MNDIGDRIKAHRGRLDMTQAELADELGMSQSAISKIEKGERQILAREILAISRALGVSIDHLVREEEASSKVLLRAGDATAPEERQAIKAFNECIDEFRGVEALVSGP